MAKLIDAMRIDFDEVDISGCTDVDDIISAVEDLIDAQPAVDAMEVVHGEWSIIEDDYCLMTALECSECKQEFWFDDEPPIKIYNFCPNCGADMRERKDNDGD